MTEMELQLIESSEKLLDFYSGIFLEKNIEIKEFPRIDIKSNHLREFVMYLWNSKFCRI